MLPTVDQIRDAAYFRWLHRHQWHGEDRNDWLSAEQDLLFGLNYEMILDRSLVETTPHLATGKGRGVCRFCERAAPSARLRPRLALPEFLGNRSLLSAEECDECHEAFRETLETELATFVAAARSAHHDDRRSSAPSSISVPALKAFARMALAILPARDLASFEETIEWVCNPDHDFDASLLRGLGCYVHAPWNPRPHAWTALARRSDLDAPMPSMLFFLGCEGLVFQVAVPLSAGDDDLDGETRIVPMIDAPYAPPHAHQAGRHDFLPMAGQPTRRRKPVLV